MKIYKYEGYHHYKTKQIAANVQKLHCQWVTNETVELLHKKVENVKTILCHGVRNGGELRMFNEVFEPDHIVGTDISPTVVNLKDEFEVYEHDFHDELSNYVNHFDLVYTNSLDHSYAPRVALSTFNNQLRENGYLVVELMIGDNNRSCEMDPLEISVDEYKELLKELNHKIIDEFIAEYKHGTSHIVVSRK
jgi:SAM-dependent methyltransferase